MRIALLHPTYWPEVRRGSERLARDLGTTLAARGHDVTLLTSHRQRPRTADEDGVRVVRGWRLPALPVASDWYDEHAGAIPAMLWGLARGDFDVVHALHPSAGWVAAKARGHGGPPFVFSVHGLVNREHLVARRYRLEMFHAASGAASLTSALSEATADSLRRYAIADPVVLPGGVVATHYAGEVARSEAPTLLCPASLGDPQKRGDVLLSAFGALRERVPEVRLLLAGGADPVFGAGPGSLLPGVQRIPAADTASLAGAYRSAWATVLPSINEAFGLVLLESLAAGTPVVAARSGACPEIVTDAAIGRLFEPDHAEDLARAMEEALALGRDSASVDACRAHAELWDWSRIVIHYEDAYERAFGGDRAAGGRATTRC